MQPPRIDYSPALPGQKRRRMMRRVALGLGALFLIVLAINSAPPAWHHAQILYWQHRAMNYTRPGDEVAYESDPAEAAKLRSAHRSLLAGSYGEAFEFPLVWDKFYQLVSPPGRQPAATLFVHARRNANGEERLVVVYGIPMGLRPSSWVGVPNAPPRATAQDFVIQAVIFKPGTAFRSPGEIAQEVTGPPIPPYPFPRLLTIPAARLRLYAGQADPRDERHFTIRGVQNGKPIIIEGWLRADDQVEYQ